MHGYGMKRIFEFINIVFNTDYFPSRYINLEMHGLVRNGAG